MFKTFFTKVGTWFKGLPSNAIKAAKAVGTAATGVVYFCGWFPCFVVKTYWELFTGFGEAAIEGIKNFFAKFKKDDVEDECVECDCEPAGAEA